MLNDMGANGVDVGKTTKKLKGKTAELRWVRSNLFETQAPLDLPPLPNNPV
jgi:hypothetical protein